MTDATKGTLTVGAILLAVIALLIFLIMGPAGISRAFQKWNASAYGSDWVIVQYTQDGSIISHWELTDKSVASETNSDGINFVDRDGNMVHLAGHYVYVQVNGSMGQKAALQKLVVGRKQLGQQ
jgi:hypothetical protein